MGASTAQILLLHMDMLSIFVPQKIPSLYLASYVKREATSAEKEQRVLTK